MGSDMVSFPECASSGSFNPRSRMGSDLYDTSWSCGRCSFNPRSRMGSDDKAKDARTLAMRVSIHAPAWGATLV